MNKIAKISTLLLLSANVFAQKSQDVQAIKGQCGCHEVTFEYAETFAPKKDYKFHDRKKTGGLEWVFVDEESKDKVVIQHLLVVGDTMIIKHWREDWQYENTDLLAYQKEMDWKPLVLSKDQVKKQWTQKVFEVNDAPRYEGTAQWIHANGKHYWENTTDAPLPRREYTTRSDYNVLRRTNHHEITDNGYIHEQDNDKVIRSAQGDEVLVKEKGLNIYSKTDDSKCKIASEWWAKNRAYWVDVRNVWGQILAQNKGLSLKSKSEDGKMMWKELDDLVEDFKKKNVTDSNARQTAIRTVINKYLNNKELYSFRN